MELNAIDIYMPFLKGTVTPIFIILTDSSGLSKKGLIPGLKTSQVDPAFLSF
jgi:hypothetical protein